MFLITLQSVVYSPTSSSVKLVLSNNSLFHCLTEVTLGVKIKVLVCSLLITSRPTIVLPAPQGSTITPCPNAFSKKYLVD